MPASPDPIVSTRALPYPADAVFAAFSDPVRLAAWWGPRGFTSTFQRFEMRPGGAWRLLMRAPDGTEYPMVKEFVEVLPPRRIVLRHHQEGHDFRMEMDFADQEGRTLLTWRMRFDSAEEAERIRGPVLQANEENFDRLEAHLRAQP